MWVKFIDIVEFSSMVISRVLEFLLCPVELVMFRVTFMLNVKLTELVILTVTFNNFSEGSMPEVLVPPILGKISCTTIVSLKYDSRKRSVILRALDPRFFICIAQNPVSFALIWLANIGTNFDSRVLLVSTEKLCNTSTNADPS